MSDSHDVVGVSQVRVKRSPVVVVLVGGLLLGGCGGDDPVDPVSSATSAASASPEPSPTADLTKRPERPAAMDEPTTDGAVAAATYMLELFPYVFNSGDVGPWEAMALDSCTFCTGVVEDVSAMRAAGDVVTGGAVDVVASEVREISAGSWFAVTLQASQESSQRRGPQGALVSENPATTYSVVFALSWDGGWRVDEMGVENPGGEQGSGT